MKKIFLIVGFVLIASLALFSFSKKTFPGISTTTTVSDAQKVPHVSVIISDGERVATYSSIPASTVFEALKQVEDSKNIEVKTKQYDFGMFIEEIGGKPNTQEFAWLYFVNGVSGDSASDKKEVQEGDTIEWRYMKPTF